MIHEARGLLIKPTANSTVTWGLPTLHPSASGLLFKVSFLYSVGQSVPLFQLSGLTSSCIIGRRSRARHFVNNPVANAGAHQ
jgi:hypothetical protein